MIDFEPSEDQRMMQDSVAQFAKSTLAPRIRESEKLRGVLTTLTVDGADFQDLNLNPNIFSATNHTSPKKTYRVFQWSNAKNDIVAADVPLSAEERDWK